MANEARAAGNVELVQELKESMIGAGGSSAKVRRMANKARATGDEQAARELKESMLGSAGSNAQLLSVAGGDLIV